MTISPQSLFQLAGVQDGLVLLTSLGVGKRTGTVFSFLALAVMANLAATILRYHQAWPTLPLHLVAVALPLCLGCLAPFAASRNQAASQGQSAGCIMRVLIVLLVGVSGATREPSRHGDPRCGSLGQETASTL